MSIQAVGWALEQTGIPTGAKFVLLSLCNAMNGHDGKCFPPQTRISKETGQGKRTVVRNLKILEDLKVIKRAARFRKDGKRSVDSYEINFGWKMVNNQPESPDAKLTHGEENPCAKMAHSEENPCAKMAHSEDEPGAKMAHSPCAKMAGEIYKPEDTKPEGGEPPPSGYGDRFGEKVCAEQPDHDMDAVLQTWNETMEGSKIPQVHEMAFATMAKGELIRCLDRLAAMDITWRQFCRAVLQSDFLAGRTPKFSAVSLPWCLSQNNFSNILTGKYGKIPEDGEAVGKSKQVTTATLPWQKALVGEIGATAYQAWFSDVEIIQDGTSAHIAVQTKFAADMMRSKFQPNLDRILGRLMGVRDIKYRIKGKKQYA